MVLASDEVEMGNAGIVVSLVGVFATSVLAILVRTAKRVLEADIAEEASD